MEKPTITSQIEKMVFELLEKNPQGVHWSELNSEIESSNPIFHPKTINGTVWKLPQKYPNLIYKPHRGVFCLIKYKIG